MARCPPVHVQAREKERQVAADKDRKLVEAKEKERLERTPSKDKDKTGSAAAAVQAQDDTLVLEAAIPEENAAGMQADMSALMCEVRVSLNRAWLLYQIYPRVPVLTRVRSKRRRSGAEFCVHRIVTQVAARIAISASARWSQRRARRRTVWHLISEEASRGGAASCRIATAPRVCRLCSVARRRTMLQIRMCPPSHPLFTPRPRLIRPAIHLTVNLQT